MRRFIVGRCNRSDGGAGARGATAQAYGQAMRTILELDSDVLLGIGITGLVVLWVVMMVAWIRAAIDED
jgi:hypothetical protein